MIDPGICWFKSVFVLELLAWQVVENPHPLVSKSGRGDHRQHERTHQYLSQCLGQSLGEKNEAKSHGELLPV